MERNYTLEKLLYEIAEGKDSIPVKGIAYDSRQVKDGFIFVAIPGSKNNGADFIKEAVTGGAKFIITQEDLSNFSPDSENIYIKVKDAREALSRLAASFYGFPSRKIKVIGITGTNGKTSTTYFLESILKSADFKVGVIGTINYRIGEKIIPCLHTTPESLELQAILKEMMEEGITHVIMEVSSHALSQRRVSQVDFDMALFTNLSQDHLDYHKDMEEYLLSKNLLFEYLGELSEKNGKKVTIVNNDDPSSGRILKTVKDFPEVDVLSFSLWDKNSIYAKVIESSLSANRFSIAGGKKNIEINLSLLGRHNVYNALAAASCALALGIKEEDIKEGLSKVKSIPGRFEFVAEKQPFKVIVDYAHTEEGLRNVLKAARALSPKRIILVFGCGGDRDRLKRPLMGKAASELADFSIITSDNPRSEEPEAISAEIEKGFSKNNYRLELDRYQAIKEALKTAQAGDLVVVAGKGHENRQIFKDKAIPFDDRAVIKEILAGKV